jgi:catechol 2,3-dioxygenase-like lactoylglutathione lyase family enzyme
MLQTARNRLIGLGFDAWTTWLRAKRVLRSAGRPRLYTLDHITIPVHDLDLARRFYCDVLGGQYAMTIDEAALRRFGRPIPENGGEGMYHVSVYMGGDTRVDLFLQSKGQPEPALGHPHYAFRVRPGDMLEWKARLESRGIPTEGPLQLGFPGQASLYFNDPSGNHLEVTCTGFTKKIPIRPPDMSGLGWDPERLRR